MPYVVNGIGTWYYGQRHIHTRDGTCQFCGAAGTLSSYDTTLFFVVVFVPLIPLSRKRIIEECPYCRKHRVLGLKEWEKAKRADVADALNRLHYDPEDRVAASQGVALASAYQDEPLLDEIVELIGAAYRRDAAFQTQLGDAYVYFANWPKAEKAYRAALEVEENDSVREGLAWTLLKQGRPQEARRYLKHVLTEKKQQSAYLIYHLISGYQAEGLHDEAIEIMDARDKAFPEEAVQKHCQQQRKTSTRYRGTPKRIRGVSLADGGKTGYRAGNWTASMPRWVAALIFIVALGAYFGSAAWIGQSRKVYLVNGSRSPYKVAVAGQEYHLAPGMATPIRVEEGDVEVLCTDAKLGVPAVHAQIETFFWTRPFVNHTFVINPDQTALIVQEETIYAAKPMVPPLGNAPVLHFGKAFYQFSGTDYSFEPFPQTIQVKANQTVTKTRVGLGPLMTDEEKVNLIAQRIPGPELPTFCERVLRLELTNSILLHWLAAWVDPGRMLQILEPRLDDRPILVEWHRAFQTVMEKAQPETDLRPRYEKLVAEMKGNADAVYLLGRAEPDLDKGEKLYRQAATANPPSGPALYGLSYRAFSDGRFADAAALLEKAERVVTDKSLYRPIYLETLLAAKDYDRLLADLKKEAQTSPQKLAAYMDISRVHAFRGQKAEARAAINQAVGVSGPAQQQAIRKALETSLCCWENDLDGYLKAAGVSTFESAFLSGQLQQAADLTAGAPQQSADAYHGLLYLEAMRTGDKDRANAHWNALLGNLKSGGRESRRFAEGLEQQQLASDFPWQRLPIHPGTKRVLLAVLAQRNPDQAGPILALAKKLNYQRDAISLCLGKFLPRGEK